MIFTQGPLDPLLETMIVFSTYENLEERIFNLFDRLVEFDGSTVNLTQFNDGMRRMQVRKSVLEG